MRKLATIVLILSLFCLGILSGVAIIYFFSPLPDVKALQEFKPYSSTKVFDRNGNLIGEFALERRDTIPPSEIPEKIKQAFVAAEDSRFYEHRGIDIPGIMRALITDIKKMRFSQGGSTITQQLVKLLFLTPEKSIKRKVIEMLLALKVERYLTKDQILGLYLNQIYLGNGVYGIVQAARSYFGKDVRDLTLGEIALLASLPKSPGFYDPRRHLERALIRRKYVLTRMMEDGYITKQEAAAAASEPVVLAEKGREKIGKYFLEYVRTYILKKYGYDALYKGGLLVYTTLDPELQKTAEESLRARLAKLEESIREEKLKEIEQEESPEGDIFADTTVLEEPLEGAVLSIDLKTGEVLAMVGGRDFSRSKFNRALMARRQPGSAFKPIIYAAAIDMGYTPADIIEDLPVEFVKNEFENWRPSNYDGRFLGKITLREALARSRNLATIRLLNKIGVGTAIKMAKNLGIESPIPSNLSIALGSLSLTLKELCRAYAAFPTLGRRPRFTFIRKIVAPGGRVLEENEPEMERVLSKETAYIMTYMLQSVIQSGTGRRARFLGKFLGGKTGTTNDYVDAWFIGFSPRVLTGVWVGYDKPVSMGKGKTGAVAALPVWIDVMRQAIKKYPATQFPLAPGIVFARIDPKTGLRTGPGEKGIMVPFRLGSVPPWQSRREEEKELRDQEDIL